MGMISSKCILKIIELRKIDKTYEEILDFVITNFI